MATFFRASDVDALLHLPGCTIDEADDEGNTPLHHARRGPQRPKPTNISDCWKEFHRNLGLAESVFDYRHQSLSIPPSATAEILRGITEITSHKAMEHGVTFELRWQGWRIPFSTAPKDAEGFMMSPNKRGNKRLWNSTLFPLGAGTGSRCGVVPHRACQDHE